MAGMEAVSSNPSSSADERGKDEGEVESETQRCYSSNCECWVVSRNGGRKRRSNAYPVDPLESSQFLSFEPNHRYTPEVKFLGTFSRAPPIDIGEWIIFPESHFLKRLFTPLLADKNERLFQNNGVKFLKIIIGIGAKPAVSSFEKVGLNENMGGIQAVDTAVRFLKGDMDAIKLEGGSPSRISAAKAIVEAGIAVIGHVGLTPQAISVLGGFRPQGKNVSSALKVVETALALQEAGCFSVVLECVPPAVAAAMTSALGIPTIGIGAGPFCSGQVTPKFCKQFGQVGDVANKALLEYKEEVTNGSFPGHAYSPYKISPSEVSNFSNELQKMGLDKAATAAAEAAEKIQAAESATGGNPESL